MRALATALAVAAVALSVGLATPGASHAVTSAQDAVARTKGAKKKTAAKAASRRRKLAKVVAFARRQIGVPYVWGGTSRRYGGFDCSGLVYAAFRSVGRAIPRTTYDQMRIGRRVSWRGLRPGDLAFTNGGGHVMLVASRTTAISAPHSGARVRYVPLAQIRDEFVGGRRVLAP
jgi:cell wall-associated NlpC family hydrolase